MLYIGFVLGVVCGAHESGLDYARFSASALILLVPALIGGRLWYRVGHPNDCKAPVPACTAAWC